MLHGHGITSCMSRVGHVWHNYAKESFFSLLKIERTARKVYTTCDEAISDIFDDIEHCYNSPRRQSKLGYLRLVTFLE
jgi:putative transposase